MKRLVVAALLVVAAGTVMIRSSKADPIIPAARVLAVFPPEPAHLDGAFGMSDPWYAKRYGDLASLTFFIGTSSKRFRPHGVLDPQATVTVFSSVQAARRSSVAIRNGGLCIAHVRRRLSNPFPSCKHYRVGNVLLIVAGWAQPKPRRSLIAALRKLGTPTTS